MRLVGACREGPEACTSRRVDSPTSAQRAPAAAHRAIAVSVCRVKLERGLQQRGHVSRPLGICAGDGLQFLVGFAQRRSSREHPIRVAGVLATARGREHGDVLVGPRSHTCGDIDSTASMPHVFDVSASRHPDARLSDSFSRRAFSISTNVSRSPSAAVNACCRSSRAL